VNARKRGKPRSSAVWVVSLVAVALAAGLIGASVWSARSGDKNGGAAVSDADLGAVPGAMGPADAKVTVIEYMDYV